MYTYVFIFETMEVQVVPVCNVGQQVEIVDGVAIDVHAARANHEYHICQPILHRQLIAFNNMSLYNP